MALQSEQLAREAAQNRAELKKMKPGDEIEVTYSEAMAVSMTPKK